jgi:hypothetical protein
MIILLKQQMPALINGGVNPDLGLVNAVPHKLHSILFDSPSNKITYDILQQHANPGDVITLTNLPAIVNIELDPSLETFTKDHKTFL